MPWSDFLLVFQWWGTLFLFGAAAYPITRHLFRHWYDNGYLCTKAVGMAVVTFLVYLGAILHIVPFTQSAVWGAMGVVFLFGIILQRSTKDKSIVREKINPILIIAEELFFFAALLFWSWVKAHEPSIHSLEKFMDFGFTKSILDSRLFPSPDMWYAGFPINYYYFGHTVMAVLTRLSGIDLTYTFNLMLATIFAFTATMSFSIGVQLLRGMNNHTKTVSVITQIGGGVLTAFLVTLAGNMQTIYAFTRGYTGDAVKPFWQLLWPLTDFWKSLPTGLNTYWYANATRFIPYTIHEFPSYSFVVSDVHGHVLSLPFTLLAIALLVHMFVPDGDIREKRNRADWVTVLFYGFLSGVLLMTNALDGPIYFGLFITLLVIVKWSENDRWKQAGRIIGGAFGAATVASLPFLLHFTSFVSGIAVNCPPAALSNTKIGPLLFESVEKCQHSPLWMWWLLWGFFMYCGIWLIGKNIRRLKGITEFVENEKLLIVFFLFSVALLIFPEFFYFKDIYPMHFRSNTMFKLGYQAFILCSIVSGYTIVSSIARKTVRWRSLFFIFLIPQLFLISIFPIFSVRSYFNSLKQYQGIYGLGWLRDQYSDNWAGINWINSQLQNNRLGDRPVIVEADGDSYTDADQFSTFTGLPTIIGWPVHEWLWRGSYDVVAPRREEVREIYELTDAAQTNVILKKYHVTNVIVGQLERQKFKNLEESKFSSLGTPVFTRGTTTIYKIL